MHSKLIAEINTLVDRFTYVVLLFKFGKVYLARSHWKYLDPEDAPLMLLGGYKKLPVDSRLHNSNRQLGVKIMYITEKLT